MVKKQPLYPHVSKSKQGVGGGIRIDYDAILLWMSGKLLRLIDI